MKYISNSVEQTIDIAMQFAETLKGGETVLLSGDLGAGKTHFAKGVARQFGIDEVVTSPTFTLHNCYQGRLTLNHFDFYRIDDPEEVAILGLDELFSVPDGVALIEWSQNVKSLLPSKCIVVTVSKTGENSREIDIQ